MIRNFRHATAAIAAAFLALGAVTAAAQTATWPTRPVRIVHGYDNGSNPDTLSRLMAPLLAERLGQPVVVESRAGAGGRIATGYVAGLPPDGTTFIMLTAGDGVVAATDPKLSYDLLRDFAFATQVIQFEFLYITGADSPVRSLADLLEAARRAPGKLTFGTPGIATTQHLAGELLQSSAGVKLQHVPFKGTAIADLLGGRIDMVIAAPAVVAAQVKSGKLRPLAVTGRARMSAYPDVPAIAEIAPDYEVSSWLGLAAPAKTEPAIIERMAAEVRRVLADESIRGRILATGSDVAPSTPEAFRARVESDVRKWKRVAAGLQLN